MRLGGTLVASWPIRCGCGAFQPLRNVRRVPDRFRREGWPPYLGECRLCGSTQGVGGRAVIWVHPKRDRG